LQSVLTRLCSKFQEKNKVILFLTRFVYIYKNNILALFVNKSLADIATFNFRKNNINFCAYSEIKICYSKVFAINFVQTIINQSDFYSAERYFAFLYNQQNYFVTQYNYNSKNQVLQTDTTINKTTLISQIVSNIFNQTVFLFNLQSYFNSEFYFDLLSY